MGSLAPFPYSLEIVGYGYILPLPAWCTKMKMCIACIGQNHESDCDGFQAWLQVLGHLSHLEADSTRNSPLLVYGEVTSTPSTE